LHPTSSPTPSPEQLACDAQAGATPSFVRLIELFEARVFSFILRRVGRRADAEDLTQDTFLRAFEKLGRYSPRWRFSTWIFTIASRLATDHLRQRARDRSLSRGVLGESDHAREGEYTLGPGAPDRGGRLWDVAAESLSAEAHAALWLRYREDLPVKDIARILGKSQVATRVMLMRARDALASSAAGLGESSRGEPVALRAVASAGLPTQAVAGGTVS
jgi:RNA polymerase sigma-70 factor (ECF subfamily)